MMAWPPRWLVHDADRRAIENDLAELHDVRRRFDGDRRAARWLRWQRAVYPLHLLFDRACTVASDWRPAMRHFGRDLLYSIRSLARAPLLAATIVLTVGVGLGATTAMVVVTRAVLVSPLPYADAGSLYWIYTDNPPFHFRFSVVDYRALEADHPTFSAVAAYQTSGVTITLNGSSERATVKDVTGSYFPLLRQRPQLGRLFDPSDDAGKDRRVVLTDAYWRSRLGADAGVVGRALTIDGESAVIVGVLEPTRGPLERGVALFTSAHWPEPKRKGPFLTMVLGRLAPGVSRTAATQALHATNRRLFAIWQSTYQDEKATWDLQDLKARVVGDVGSTLFVVLAAVACVLLIACANAVNLLLARAVGRSRELAIRGALGASRGRLLQIVLAEAAALTAGAVVVGLAIAAATLTLVARYAGATLPRIDEIHMGPAALAWLGSLAVASGLVIGVVPAVYSLRLRMSRTLAASGRSGGDAPTARRLRRLLVATEFALVTPLVIGAVLVGASLDRLRHVPVGVDTARLLTAEIQLTGPRYREDASRAAFWQRAIERLAALPGVDSAALADSRPPVEAGQRNNFDLEDHPTPAGQNQPISTWVGVSPEFFRTAGIRLERGRLLDAHSLDDNVIVVDRAWADRFFPGEEVLGRRLHSGGCTTCPWTTVVGVVGNVKWIGLDAPEDGTVYFPFVDLSSGYLVLRTTGDPATLALDLQRAARELDPTLAVSNISTGDALVADSLAQPRSLTVFVALFAVTALVLSIVGVYGVMAYFVQQHARDIGVRLALGGEPRSVRRLVVVQGLRLVLVGVAVGMGLTLASSRLVSAVLFDVKATDVGPLVAVPLILVTIAALACLIPARRAARLDPARILRES